MQQLGSFDQFGDQPLAVLILGFERAPEARAPFRSEVGRR
jgi:hypothetical protein